MEVAERRLKEIVGIGSPEVVPTELITRDMELLVGIHGGHRIAKYGNKYGLTPLFALLGDAVKQPIIKDYAHAIGNAVVGFCGLVGLLVLRGKWTRILSFGALFQSTETGIDFIEQLVTGRVGGKKSGEKK